MICILYYFDRNTHDYRLNHMIFEMYDNQLSEPLGYSEHSDAIDSVIAPTTAEIRFLEITILTIILQWLKVGR